MPLDTQLSFDYPPTAEPRKPTTARQVETPAGYKGLAAFHKYWGKKPVECLSFLIDVLTEPGDLVVDPFVGSGFVGREAALRGRRFLGIDINPVAVELSRLLLNLPDRTMLCLSLAEIEREVREPIHATYQMADGSHATHYLWNAETLQAVWRVERGKGGRQEFAPTPFDKEQLTRYEDYRPIFPRPLRPFHNSRINTAETLTFDTLFTGRARHNIDLLLQAIHAQPDAVRNALLLALTSASGQMSRMVFAITGRGKTTGTPTNKVEVGSWVIGYWRPKLHFEISVWNCFHHRAAGLVKALAQLPCAETQALLDTPERVLQGTALAAIVEADARCVLASLPPESVSLLLTDPPHSDRIPYLELSEMWNALLGRTADYEHEIVVSNARGRNKSKAVYTADMQEILRQAARVLKPGKFLVLLFNARDSASWQSLAQVIAVAPDLCFRGSFPLHYSANSVVQDNREGSLKTDYVLIYQKQGPVEASDGAIFERLPKWSAQFPVQE